jgi:hypothetical protein
MFAPALAVCLPKPIYKSGPYRGDRLTVFYKPKYCCNCGEKIERVEWRLWTSRRFCSVCEIEQKGHELLPRVILGTAIVFGIFGIGTYFQGQHPETGGKQAFKLAGAEPKRPEPAGISRDPKRQAEVQVSDPGKNIGTPETTAAEVSKVQPGVRPTASQDPVYFCGAMTKKGKPCSRRVKLNQRCWQHAGMPAAPVDRKTPDVF